MRRRPAGDRQAIARAAFDGDWPKLPIRSIWAVSRTARSGKRAREVSTAKRSTLACLRLRSIWRKSYQEKLRRALQSASANRTPDRDIRETTGNTARDRAACHSQPGCFVRDLVENFDATIVESSIKPVSDRRHFDNTQLAGLMKQASKMQESMAAPGRARLRSKWRAVGRGHGQGDDDLQARRQAGQIDPSLLADDKDMLEDLVAAAINDAARKVEAAVQEKCRLTGGLGLPPG